MQYRCGAINTISLLPLSTSNKQVFSCFRDVNLSKHCYDNWYKSSFTVWTFCTRASGCSKCTTRHQQHCTVTVNAKMSNLNFSYFAFFPPQWPLDQYTSYHNGHIVERAIPTILWYNNLPRETSQIKEMKVLMVLRYYSHPLLLLLLILL